MQGESSGLVPNGQDNIAAKVQQLSLNEDENFAESLKTMKKKKSSDKKKREHKAAAEEPEGEIPSTNAEEDSLSLETQKQLLAGLIDVPEDKDSSLAHQSGAVYDNGVYPYADLLTRIFQTLRRQNPDLAGEKKKYTIVPPSIHREGNKKTLFANIVEICKRMNRAPDHVIQYLFAELGTTGSTDGEQHLIIRGRFQQKQIENVLKRYIVEYVSCKTCKSPNTVLRRENRLFFQQCESCGSTRSVSAIKSGFKAQTEKRSTQRNKEAQ